jgi:TetR/AcrR family transcriptional repressor of nem operon
MRPSKRAAGAHAAPTTATQILDVAERLAQTRGFNGFSYADIAAELGITKASLHYHYGTKAALGLALMERYSAQFAAALARIEAEDDDAPARLRRYVQVYGDVLRNDRACLCGMLAAEFTTLPHPLQLAIRRFFDDNEVWLARVLDAGRRSGQLAFESSALEAARVLVAALEGAMLLARSYGQANRFTATATQLLRSLGTTAAARRR